jgi:hypothetical protein
MIPSRITFTVKGGTGLVFQANLTDDAKHYLITFGEDRQCTYTTKEVFGFLRSGQWESDTIKFK